MDLEDKLVDDRELAQLELQHRSDRDEQGEATLPEPELEVVADVTQSQRYHLLQALHAILGGHQLHIEQLHLPARESVALEALQVAMFGHSRIGTFVYATDRRDMLEQALAVLQPDLTYQNDPAARELHAELVAMAHHVADLRHQLTQLEDSEDELLSDHEKDQLAQLWNPNDKPGQPPAKPGQGASAKPGQPAAAAGQGASAKPDARATQSTPAKSDSAKPGQPPARSAQPDLAAGNKPPSTSQSPGPSPDGDPDAPRPTTLIGPDLPEPPPQPTTLTGSGPGGPGSVDQPVPPASTTLAGPDVPEPPPPPTTLTGSGPGGLGSVDQPAPPTPTTLAGPDLPDEPRPPSLLDGDGPGPESAAADSKSDDKTKRSWWRKPFG